MNALKHHSELTAINIVNAIAAAWLCCTDRLGAAVGLARPGGIGERALA